MIHNYKLYDAENVLFHEFKSLKSNAGDNLKDDLSQIDLFYVKLNKDHDRIKIELILSMKEGVTGAVYYHSRVFTVILYLFMHFK